MKPIYAHKQPGWAILVILITSIIFFSLVIGFAWEEGTTAPLLFLLFFILGIAVIFSSLTVMVDSQNVTFHFAFRFFKHVIPVSRITKVRVVRNKIWYGLGIHFIPGGVVYNVSGLDAVELKLDDGKLVRVGSDEPGKLSIAVDQARDLQNEFTASIIWI